MRRPSFQFYPGDWTGNSNLKRCTLAEKGAWLEVMCLMHDQPEYGVLRWRLKDITDSVPHCTQAMLRSLIAKGVMKGSDEEFTEPFVYTPRSGRKDGPPVTLIVAQQGPLWYSSRMVRDEYVRVYAGAATRFGADKQDTKPAAGCTPTHAPLPTPSRRDGEVNTSPSHREGAASDEFENAQSELILGGSLSNGAMPQKENPKQLSVGKQTEISGTPRRHGARRGVDQGDGSSSSSASLTTKTTTKSKDKGAAQAPLDCADLLEKIDPQVVGDWVVLRKAKKAPVTRTAIAGLQAEADEAGISLQAAMTKCCMKGWAGSWGQSNTKPNGHINGGQYKTAKTLEYEQRKEWIDDLTGKSKQPYTIDIPSDPVD